MKRISVTTIEKCRRYLHEVSIFDTEEAVIDTIKGLFLGNDKTKFGSAHHKLIEVGVNKAYQILFDNTDLPAYPISFEDHGEVITVFFTQEQLKPSIQYRKDHPIKGSEIKLTKIYPTKYGPIQVSGIIDVIEGLRLRDAKNTFRERDDKEYRDSCQSKFYLDMAEVDDFYYDPFLIQNFTALPTTQPDPKITITPLEPIHCMRFPYMEQYLTECLNDILDFINQRNLWIYLKDATPNEIYAF